MQYLPITYPSHVAKVCASGSGATAETVSKDESGDSIAMAHVPVPRECRLAAIVSEAKRACLPS